MSGEYGKKPSQGSATATVLSSTPDLKVLRLPQDFAANIGVRKLLVQVPVTKPHRQWFVRTRPGDGWRIQIAMIELKDVGESYAVNPSLAMDLPNDVKNFDLVTAINRHGQIFLWPLRMPNSSRQDSWADSAIAACAHAETKWLRTSANMQAGTYDVFEATGKLPEPEWPDETFAVLFQLAFRDRVIDSIDHPVLRQLKGAA